MKYESKTWKLLNVDELPKDNRERIDCKNCIGKVLKYKLKTNGTIYKIKIVDYIKEYKDKENKRIEPKFKVEYIYLKDTKSEEIIVKNIFCTDLINKVKINGIIPSLNQWMKKDDYWIGIDTKGREFKFSSNNKETEYNILHSTWCNRNGYILTSNLNYTSQKWCLHKVIYFNCNKKESDENIHNCIDHINNDRTDNRIENLRLATKGENAKNKNTNNKYGLVGLHPNGKGYYSYFVIEGYKVNTKTKHDLEEAKIDNLIAQRYLGYKHNEDQFYKLNELSEERIKEVIDLLDKKIEGNRNKTKKQKEYIYDYIEKDNLIGIKTFKKDGTPNEMCWVDRDFGRIEGDKFIVNGNISIRCNKYFYIRNYRINVYVIVGELSVHNYRNYNFHVDHINQKTNENYRDNLEIVTIQSNMMNKNSKGYTSYKEKGGVKYRVQYAYNWKYLNLYIGGLKNPIFNTEEEAIAEVKRRKEIVNKYRFRVKTLEELNEVIDFSEEHKIDIDSAYIVWAGLDTLVNIKNNLK